MKKFTLLAILLVCFPHVGRSQAKRDEPDLSLPYKASGYGSFGVGFCRHGIVNINGNAGGDVLLRSSRFSLGGEVGAYRFIERDSPVFGITALNFGYHFADPKDLGKADPFVSFGPGLLFGQLGSGWNGGFGIEGGGGLNYWLRRKTGIRTEVRVYIMASDVITAFRFGFSFR